MDSCIECGGTLAVPEDVFQGEIIPCGDCGLELEVLETTPLAFGQAPEVQEDWGE